MSSIAAGKEKSAVSRVRPARQSDDAATGAPLGWAVIVRPDRCVMAEGPIEQVATMLEQALGRIEPAPLADIAPDTTYHPLRATHAS